MFWYFVAVEVEMRSRGASLIRSSRRILEALKAVVLAATGLGGIAYVYWDGHRLLLLEEIYPSRGNGSLMADAIIGGLFSAIWAIVLIMLSFHDLQVAFRKR